MPRVTTEFHIRFVFKNLLTNITGELSAVCCSLSTQVFASSVCFPNFSPLVSPRTTCPYGDDSAARLRRKNRVHDTPCVNSILKLGVSFFHSSIENLASTRSSQLRRPATGTSRDTFLSLSLRFIFPLRSASRLLLYYACAFAITRSSDVRDNTQAFVCASSNNNSSSSSSSSNSGSGNNSSRNNSRLVNSCTHTGKDAETPRNPRGK